MSAHIIDGKAVAAQFRDNVSVEVGKLSARGIRPGLAVVLVGQDPASISYVTAKERACAEVGIASFQRHLPSTVGQDELLSLVRELNENPAVHGILVQLPLPAHLDERAVVASISPEKDVDGFTPINVGRMLLEEPCYIPCTPRGIIELIKKTGVATSGARAVIVGRSNIVGKPLANLMARKSFNATVTLCHSGTIDLASYCRSADILVACAGKPQLISGDMIKPGSCVIDVGVNRVSDPQSSRGYRLTGDVDFDAAKHVAGWITPVPGGVGPMTIAMLLANTVEAAKAQSGRISS